MFFFVLQEEATYFNIKLRLNDTSFVRSGFCNDYNFAKTKTTKLYEIKNIIQGIADDYLYRGGLSLNLLDGFQ